MAALRERQGVPGGVLSPQSRVMEPSQPHSLGVGLWSSGAHVMVTRKMVSEPVTIATPGSQSVLPFHPVWENDGRRMLKSRLPGALGSFSRVWRADKERAMHDVTRMTSWGGHLEV